MGLEPKNQVAIGAMAFNQTNPHQHAVCKIFVASHHKGPYKDPGMKEFGQYDLSESVIQCSTNETFQGGSANFVLVPKRPWKSLIWPGDWVSIYFSSGANARKGFGVEGDPEAREESIRVFFGFIDSVGRQTATSSEGVTTVRINVACSGIQKAFDRTSIYFNKNLGFGSAFGSFMPGLAQVMLGIPMQGTPATIPRSLALTLLGYGGQFQMPDCYPKGVGTPAERRERLEKYFQAAISVERALGFAGIRGTNGTVSPAILEKISKNVNAEFSANSIASIVDLFSYVEDLFVDGEAHNLPQHDLSNSVWSNMVENSNPSMNEMFLTLMPEREVVSGASIFSGDTDEWGQYPKYVPSLVLRERPFGWHDWVFRPPQGGASAGAQTKLSDIQFGNVFFSSREKPARVPMLRRIQGNVSGIQALAQTLAEATAGPNGTFEGNRSLDRVKLQSQDIVASEDTNTDNDLFNFRMISSNSLLLSESDQKFTLLQSDLIPMFLAESIKMYGLRVQELSTKFMFSGASKIGDSRTISFLVRMLLAHDYWNQHSPYYDRGTISSRGVPKARVGMALDVESPSKERSYYIEGVAHQWTHQTEGQGHLATTFTVTRGQPSGFADPTKRFHYAPPNSVDVYVYDSKGDLVKKDRKVASARPVMPRTAAQEQRIRNAKNDEDRREYAKLMLILNGGDVKEAGNRVAQHFSIEESVGLQIAKEVKLSEQQKQTQKQEAAKARASSTNPQRTTAIRKLIDIVARFESRGDYGAINPDDAGAGVSYGLIQFNQKRGTLPQLFKEMNRRDPVLFNKIFGSWVSTMLGPTIRTVNLNVGDFKNRLRIAGVEETFRQVQLDLARIHYFDPTDALADKYGWNTERARALMFDTAVQFGFNGRNGTPDFVRRAIKKAKEINGTENVTLRQQLAQFVVLVDDAAKAKLAKAGIVITRKFRRAVIFDSTRVTDELFDKVVAASPPTYTTPDTAIMRTTVSKVQREAPTRISIVEKEDRRNAGKPPWIIQPELHGEMYDPIRRSSGFPDPSSPEGLSRIQAILARAGKK